jgi:hypothetical protein
MFRRTENDRNSVPNSSAEDKKLGIHLKTEKRSEFCSVPFVEEKIAQNNIKQERQQELRCQD